MGVTCTALQYQMVDHLKYTCNTVGSLTELSLLSRYGLLVPVGNKMALRRSPNSTKVFAKVTNLEVMNIGEFRHHSFFSQPSALICCSYYCLGHTRPSNRTILILAVHEQPYSYH